MTVPITKQKNMKKATRPKEWLKLVKEFSFSSNRLFIITHKKDR